MSETSDNFREQVANAKVQLAEGDTLMDSAAAQNISVQSVVNGLAHKITGVRDTITSLTQGDTAAIPVLQATVSNAYEWYGLAGNTLVMGLEGTGNSHAHNAVNMTGALSALVGGPLSEISIATQVRTAGEELELAAHALADALSRIDKAIFALYNSENTAQIVSNRTGEGMSQIIAEDLTAYQQDIGYTGP